MGRWRGPEEECEGTDVNLVHFWGSTTPSDRPVGTGIQLGNSLGRLDSVAVHVNFST